MENNDIAKKIYTIIKKNRGTLSRDLSPETTLQSDLGIDGIDAEEVIMEYFETFDIDASGFNFPDYFGEDAFSIQNGIKRLLNYKKRKIISISHMISCAIEKKWTASE